MSTLQSILPFALGGMALVVLFLFAKGLLGVVSIPQGYIGVVNKKFVLAGRNRILPDGHIIALYGEPGIQADTLGPGLYFGYWPWQYSVQRTPNLVVDPGELGIVEASDGEPLPTGRVLAKVVNSNSFQDARSFLSSGGQRGQQIGILAPGTYRINPILFKVTKAKQTEIPQDSVGIVTTLEGTPLTTGEIAGSIIQGHNSFQDGQKFIDAGGNKGLQEGVLLAGRYNINPLFAKVQLQDLTEIPIGHVGVVIAYVGDKGANVAGDGFTQGTIVEVGKKGVWADPLDPGRYPINQHTHKVELVPTTNIVLNWAKNKSEAHQLDANLCPITVRSSDGFTFNLDVQQIIHISRQNASRVIARFGNMINLVTQVLEPLIGNYFRNSSQKSDVIAFLGSRSERQNDAALHIKDALTRYNVEAVDTLIGDITPPAELMKTLTDRKVAEQQQVTYATQQTAETKRAELNEQTALANTKQLVVEASRGVEISKLQAEAAVNKATGEANARVLEGEAQAKVTVLTGEADAKRTIVTGDAESQRTSAVGGAEADVLRKKVEAVGKEGYTAMQIVDYLATHGIKLVPEVLVGSSDGKGGLLDAVLARYLVSSGTTAEPNGIAAVIPSSSKQ